MKTKDVLILSAIDPTRAYSCIKYLCSYLHMNKIDVELWSNVPVQSINEYKKWDIDTFSYLECIFGRIPKIRTYYKKIIGIKRAYAYKNKVIICHDLFHYKACVEVKQKYPDTQLILYFTEIFTDKSSPLQKRLQKYFLKYPNMMDYMIECDYCREMYRKRENGVAKYSNTILNTIPYDELKDAIEIPRSENYRPIIVYSGGIHTPGEFDIIIDAIKDIDLDFEMLFICFGNQEAIDDLQTKCKKYLSGRYRIETNKTREQVFKSIRNADIGIVYYDPEYSINTLYAAPTKFYEYVGLNIPVVCSKNESLEKIIQNYGLGQVMQKNNSNGMKKAILRLLEDKTYRESVSQNEKKAFEENLCYEKQSQEGINKLLSIISINKGEKKI